MGTITSIREENKEDGTSGRQVFAQNNYPLATIYLETNDSATHMYL